MKFRSLIVALTFALPLVALIAQSGWPWGVGADTDTMMRLAFIEHAAGTGSLDGFFPRDGAPGGMYLHWTWPYNFVVLALAAPLAPALGWHAALTWTAPLHGPLALMLLVWAVYWTTAPFLYPATRLWTAALAGIAPPVLAYAAIGRVDHHILSVALTVLSLGAALRVVRYRGHIRPGILAGLLVTLTLWQSIEALPGILVAMVVMIAYGARWRRAHRAVAAFACSAILSSWAALLLNPPAGGVFARALDRHSIVHAALLTVVAAAWLCAEFVAGRRPAAWRAAILWGFTGAALSIWAMLFLRRPNFPDAIVSRYVWDRVGEIEPGYANWRNFGFAAIPQLPALAIAVVAWLQRRSRRQGPGRLLAAGAMGGYFVLGLLFVRFTYYGDVFAAILIGGAVAGFFNRRFRDRNHWVSLTVLAFFVGTAILAAPFVRFAIGRPAVPGCRLGGDAAQALESAFPADAIVFADVWLSPEILWRTRLRTVAGPYHRNQDGLRDVAQVMTSMDDGQARAVLARRQAAAVVVCAGPPVRDDALPDAERRTLGNRLAAGDSPAWLVPIPLPSPDIRAFRIVGEPRER